MIQPIAKECQSQVQNEDWANATETWGSVEEAVERTESTYLDIFFFFFGPFSIGISNNSCTKKKNICQHQQRFLRTSISTIF